ncbi:M17 family peptidase N-terminal domain-containing protein [Actinoplanes sp. NPDC051513]|uniref:M17 family peptidase N-terminal domain-containing protein n=1 Tax=Actinoplanes sp. NPDC051513 TaxID=3363908 RepID=UPI00378FCAAA
MTPLTVTTDPVAALPADCIVVGVAKGPDGPRLAPGATVVNEAFAGRLIEFLGALGVTGAEGEAVKLPAPAGIELGLILAVGLGYAPDDRYEAEALRRAAGVATRTLAGTEAVVLALPAETAEVSRRWRWVACSVRTPSPSTAPPTR